jgi:hypothetical protein
MDDGLQTPSLVKTWPSWRWTADAASAMDA